ncbi:MAG: hypothetical protein NVSMB19_22380 [Vulcanimicrobiaceae bacterium]
MRVLLLDDAAVSRRLIVRIVRDLGHDVVALAVDPSVPDGVAALSDAIRAASPAVAIVDGRLGDPLGIRPDAGARLAATVALLRGIVPHAVVGVVAAVTEASLARAGAAAGAAFVVPRPILRAHLGATLTALPSASDAPLR